MDTDLHSEYSSPEYYDVEMAGTCEECGQPLEVMHEPNGDSDYNILGYCRKCDIYYG
jgi:predicted nucleic acid binding AN1-type Zn finger protein